jgi:hypothetical protein
VREWIGGDAPAASVGVHDEDSRMLVLELAEILLGGDALAAGTHTGRLTRGRVPGEIVYGARKMRTGR